VAMFNVHASGGVAMMAAARQGVDDAAPGVAPKVIAVTILTSIDQPILNDELRVPGAVEAQVLHLAKRTEAAGLDGIVCSATDLHALALVHGLTAYDAAYLSLAKTMNAPLLTFDLKLADAAARALGSPD